MKKIIIIIIAITFNVSTGFSQDKKTEPAKLKKEELSNQVQPGKDSIPDEIKVYHLALSFADYDVAKNALFSLIAKNPTRINYIDSLARIYFSMGAYPQCLAAADFVLKSQPESEEMLELSAVSHNAMKNSKESLALYEKLYAKTKSIYHLYQVAIMQYSLQRYGECSTTIESILVNKDALKEKIRISYDEQNTQEVPFAAAAYNLRGVMEKDLSQPDKAKKDFEEALKIFPEFQLAKNNLELMAKPAETNEKEKDKSKKK